MTQHDKMESINPTVSPVRGTNGLSLRDLMATAIIGGFAARGSVFGYADLSKAAYEFADAMLEARQK